MTLTHANGTKTPAAVRGDVLNRLVEIERDYAEKRAGREAQSSYLAGESDRMNPIPRGIDPLGTDADYHYRTSRNYFLMVERGRAAVRNHPLVEQGVNRLIANLKLGQNTLEVDSGDLAVDDALTADWEAWASSPTACDYERSRSFQQIDRQSFFNQVVDGDILHVPLRDGRLQTFESHHMRTPFGHRPTGASSDGIVHGVEVRNNQIVAYHVTPQSLSFAQSMTRLSQSRRIPAFDADGNKVAFWLGFRHRFNQRRGISRLSPPRDAMNGFDDLNYANIKSSLRRALISYLMESTAQPLPGQLPGTTGGLPQAGSRYALNEGLGLETAVIEQLGEPAQVFKTPVGYKLQGWNANLPSAAFFDHASLLLTMLSVNLDLPLMFLLLDGSLVNFHGGRMTFDQAKMRFAQIQQDQIEGLWKPTYEWRIRRKLIYGSPDFDPALVAAVERGINPLRYKFHPPAWAYVKPMEDAAAEKLAETSNLRSQREILASRGHSIDKLIPEVIFDRGQWAREAIREAIAIRDEFPDAEIEVPRFFRELIHGVNPGGVQLAVSAGGDSGDGPPKQSQGATSDE